MSERTGRGSNRERGGVYRRPLTPRQSEPHDDAEIVETCVLTDGSRSEKSLPAPRLGPPIAGDSGSLGSV